jgi:hypothetical protein
MPPIQAALGIPLQPAHHKVLTAVAIPLERQLLGRAAVAVAHLALLAQTLHQVVQARLVVLAVTGLLLPLLAHQHITLVVARVMLMLSGLMGQAVLVAAVMVALMLVILQMFVPIRKAGQLLL